MRILITGASGFIGSHIVQALRSEHDIVACVRNPRALRARFPGIDVIACDFATDLSATNWIPRLQSIDAVINTVGIIRESKRQSFDRLHHQVPCALFRACEQMDIKRVIQISALGADETAISHYHRSKKAADDCLKQLDLNWIIIKPSLVYGPGGKSAAFFKALSALPAIPIVDNGEQLVQPIHIDDLTAVISAMLLPNAPARVSADAVGPQPIRFKDMLLQYRHWLGKARPFLVPIPYSVALLTGKFAGFLGETPLTHEAVKMLRQGNTGDVSTLKAVTMPRSFESALREQPAQQADRWHAGLFFLRPLLRITLGLLWLLTGILSLGIYPVDQSLALLAQVGISGSLAPFVLYGAALLDIALGLATLVRWQLHWVGLTQITLMMGYSVLITVGLPEYWLHPFGPITKNIPLIVATLIMLVLEER